MFSGDPNDEKELPYKGHGKSVPETGTADAKGGRKP